MLAPCSTGPMGRDGRGLAAMKFTIPPRPPSTTFGMQRSRAWCGTPPILGVVNMVGTRNFTCYMGAL